MVASIREAPVEDGVAVWHARTVPELADALRVLAGRLAEVEAPAPPDLSAYALQADLEALTAEVAALQAQVTDLEARVAALETPPAP